MPLAKRTNRKIYGSKPGKLSKRNPINEDQVGTAHAKRSRFIDYYMINLSVKEAAQAVGISIRQGSKYLNKPEIQLETQERMERRSQRLQIDSDYVLETIRDTVERCRSLKPVRTREGIPILVHVPDHGEAMALVEFDAMAVLKGCELLGKHLKMFTEKFVLDFEDIENMTDQQLSVLANRIRRALMKKSAIDGDQSDTTVTQQPRLTEGVELG
jgi:phage terminase small subunit